MTLPAQVHEGRLVGHDAGRALFAAACCAPLGSGSVTASGPGVTRRPARLVGHDQGRPLLAVGRVCPPRGSGGTGSGPGLAGKYLGRLQGHDAGRPLFAFAECAARGSAGSVAASGRSSGKSSGPSSGKSSGPSSGKKSGPSSGYYQKPKVSTICCQDVGLPSVVHLTLTALDGDCGCAAGSYALTYDPASTTYPASVAKKWVGFVNIPGCLENAHFGWYCDDNRDSPTFGTMVLARDGCETQPFALIPASGYSCSPLLFVYSDLMGSCPCTSSVTLTVTE